MSLPDPSDTALSTPSTVAADVSTRDGSGRLLDVSDLHVEFRTDEGVVNAVNGVSYSLGKGESLAILGESGSGKSVAAQAIMGTLDSPPGFVTGGHAYLQGVDLLALPSGQLRRLRGRHLAMVVQDALNALNPVLTVGFQIAEMFRKHEGLPKSVARKRALELMGRVRIPQAGARLDDYPHQLSGGMRQRVVIAMAMALNPDVLIADEPTTALDVTTQAQIMALLAELQQQTGMGLLLITHDLGIVAETCDRVCVMYAGRIVEHAPIDQLYAAPAHPYTRGLMHSVPRLQHGRQRLEPITGQPPDLMAIPAGCEFHPRCRYARPICQRERPPLSDVDVDGGGGRQSACYFAEEVAGGQ